MTFGRFLFDELAKAGVRHIFGVPGDMALNLFRAAAQSPVRPVATTNELNAGYAADFYARANGLGALLVTFNVGSLSALNAVAEAAAERSPLLVVMGAPGERERRGPIALHHEIVHNPRGGTTTQNRVYRAAGIRQFAPGEVRAAIAYVKRASRPAFIEAPRDIVDTEVAQAEAPEIPPAARLEEGIALVRKRLEAAQRPVLMAGTALNRYRLQESAVRLAEQLNAPVVGTMLGKSAFPETHSLYHGVCFGQFSEGNADLVAQSDCVINLGEHWTDFNLGIGTSPLRYSEVLHLQPDGVHAGGRRVLDVPLAELLPALAEQSWQAGAGWPRRDAAALGNGFGLGCLAEALNEGSPGEMNVVVDVGDAFMLGTQITMPRVNSFFTSPYYASMGLSVPAALGLTLATGRRTLALIGDGSFQMVMNSLADSVRYGAHPIIVLMNNRSFGTLRQMESAEVPYLTVDPLQYADLARALGCRAGSARDVEGFQALWREAVADREHTHVIEMQLPEHYLSEPGMQLCAELKKRIRG